MGLLESLSLRFELKNHYSGGCLDIQALKKFAQFLRHTIEIQ